LNANTYDSPGRAGGNREDLRNVLTILEPEETPFTSLAKKGPSPSATYAEVLVSSLRKPRTNGTKEGQDAGKGNNKAKNRQRIGTYIHRIQDEFGVTDVQQAVSKKGGTAAVSNEYAEDKAQTIREMKRDMEAINCSKNEHNGANDQDMTTRGVFAWLDPVKGPLQTVNPVPDLFRTPTGNIISGVGNPAALTEDQLVGQLQSLKTVYGGKRTYTGILGNNIQAAIDHFTRTNTSSTATRYHVQQDAETHEISMYVEIFDCSFGRIECQTTEFNNVGSDGLGDPNAGLILNMDLFELDFLEPLHAVDQEVNSGGMSGYAKAMWANLCLNPRGNGKIYNTGA